VVDRVQKAGLGRGFWVIIGHSELHSIAIGVLAVCKLNNA
jgi:hypothetical protein